MIPKISDEVLEQNEKDRDWFNAHLKNYRITKRIIKGNKKLTNETECAECQAKVIIGRWYNHKSRSCTESFSSVNKFIETCPDEIIKAYSYPNDTEDRNVMIEDYLTIKSMMQVEYKNRREVMKDDLVDCPCGGSFIRGTDKDHVFTRKHQLFLSDKQSIKEYLAHMESVGKSKKDLIPENSIYLS